MTRPLLGNSISPNRRRALFETTKRVLASAINDGIACATLESCNSTSLLLCLRSPGGAIASDEDAWIMCGMRADAYTETDGGRVLGFVRADDLLEPVLSRNLNGEVSEELDPGVICRVICRWRSRQDEEHAVETLVKEVRNSANNQVGKILQSLLPQDLWIFEEAASVTGAQEDFDKACQLTCIIRKSLEKRAADIGETLIPVAGLLQRPFNDDRTREFKELRQELDRRRPAPKKQSFFKRFSRAQD
ncbi:hypothetical protein RIB2604_02005180 [Aspergillus luchuensis]|uniref:Uncharacterized protein n=1 Tax=Aspergillus kawachii TaxID=1069201 RepID=A0A146FJL9_ASPKA|nr:hypothetical protein RIB2604_02005180 [Aspergillus luchuensis]